MMVVLQFWAAGCSAVLTGRRGRVVQILIYTFASVTAAAHSTAGCSAVALSANFTQSLSRVDYLACILPLPSRVGPQSNSKSSIGALPFHTARQYYMSSTALAPRDRRRLALAPLTSEHIERGAALICDALSDDYSWGRAVGITEEDHRSWMQCVYLPKRADDEAVPSLVAMSCADDSALSPEMVGACTVEDFVPLPSEGDEDKDADAPPGLTALHALVDECEAIFWRSAVDEGLINALAINKATGKPITPPRGRFGYIAYLAVDAAHRRQRIGDQLVAAADAQFAAAGFSHNVAFCSSNRSRSLFSARGYSYLGGVSYQNFEMPDRSRPFASLPRDECAVMVREL
jgi:hypothetical protein